MSRQSIEALASGHYWAVPHAPFALDGGNGHDEVFPGADCVSDGKWVTFYKVAPQELLLIGLDETEAGSSELTSDGRQGQTWTTIE
ncbi:hypothetical protein [Cupriavidus pinatubonensis]|uniref:Uncharacterized protein n=1 Tax=Cupriavidus pinatubonensis TaxID=248026 RepID=A0ABM8Y2T0_9BURK|nr:hypothetical protein [Cupriavidus pinatubonensis]CAG9187046.1 hypothetical protein LMG23994_06526 [Cupriavidus pinatubonensis]